MPKESARPEEGVGKDSSAATATNAASDSSAPATVTICNCSHHCKHDCCPPKQPDKEKPAPAKSAPSALKKSEILRLIDFGLGRGVDATNATPWANKSAFQVRPVTMKNILATEEGGTLHSYEREVWSSVSLHANLKVGVEVPIPSIAPVEIGADAELSRSKSFHRRTVGKKVVNRSVSFMSDYHDVNVEKNPTDDAGGVAQSTDNDNKQQSGSAAEAHSDLPPFEQRLSEWILEKIKHDTRVSSSPTSLADFISSSDEEQKKLVLLYCYQFVRHFKITHYISTIDIGALEYTVSTETEFNMTIGGGGSLDPKKIVSLSAGSSRTSKSGQRALEVKRIGKISDGKVGRGTHEEAVVGLKVVPLFTLVREIPYLQAALQWSVNCYMEEERDTSSGPFLVAFGTEKKQYYWKVKDNKVSGTSNIDEAAPFFILPYDNRQHPHEFHIAFMGEATTPTTGATTIPTSKSLPRYLNADVSVFGTNSGPLKLEYHVSDNSRLVLFGRTTDEKVPVNPTTWAQGDDKYFINCAHRRMKKDGYIGIKEKSRNGEVEWRSACFSRRGCHDEDRNKFLLFHLLRTPSFIAHPRATKAPPFKKFKVPDTLDQQLEQYGVELKGN